MASFHLLTTKLSVPPTPEEKVARPHLLGRLDRSAAPGTRLVLVCAPAGYGKTTLAGDWVRKTAAATAWLSLDAADNDPNLFLAYLVAALRRACPALTLDPLTYLHAQQAVALEPTVGELINGLAEAAGPITLVLDDYHLIQDPAIHEGVIFLLEV